MNQEDVGYQRIGQWGGGPKSGLNTRVKALWVKAFWRKALCGKALWRKAQWVSSYKRVFYSTVCIPVWLVFKLKGVPHGPRGATCTKCSECSAFANSVPSAKLPPACICHLAAAALINKVKCNCSTPQPLIYIPAKSNLQGKQYSVAHERSQAKH